MRTFIVASLTALLGAVASQVTASTSAGPTAQEIVEFTRIVQPRNQNDDALREQISPDGTQAFIVTRKADVASDRNRYEIQLLDLRADRLAMQRSPDPAVIFSAAIGPDNNGAEPAIQDVEWHGERTLVFLARLQDDSWQVYRLDVPTRELKPLTHETNLIVSFAASQDLRRVVYAVQLPNPPLREGDHGVVVGNQSFWSVKFGQHDLRSQQPLYRYFVSDVGSSRPARAIGEAFSGFSALPLVNISPDGRWALMHRHVPERLAAWERQYPMVAELSKKYARSQQVDPLQYFSRPLSYVPRLSVAWRLDDGHPQTIMDAPDDTQPGSSQLRRDYLWQGTGASVVLAGTHLPPAPDGTVPSASHIIEYWPDSGRWRDVATLEARLEDVHASRDGFVVMDGARRREFLRQPDGGWRESSSGNRLPTKDNGAGVPRIVQGLNQPPDVYASGVAGQATRLTSLNPQFDAETWGTMLPYAWSDAAGRRWEGGLMSASGMDSHAPHPLVIQTYGFSPDRFYLDGSNIVDGFTSGFAGRAFLRDGILVLAMPWRAAGGPPQGERQARLAFNDGVRGAVDALVREGRVDPSKVGIIGWSATGERVLNLLTFDDLPIQAATMADGDSNTLFSLALTYGAVDSIWGRKEEVNEGLPFGAGLAGWIRNDSALHTDCIRTALRIETYGPWVENNWDVYALLRRQYKPADMIVIPEGTHSLGTPGDRMVSLQGNVDWYAFWLAGKTRTAPLLASETAESVAAQYVQWRQMQALKAADDARPRCVR